MLTLDTSGVIAAADARDRFHDAAVSALSAERALVIPGPILAETMFMLRRRLGTDAERAFLAGLARGEPAVDDRVDFARVSALLERYDDLDLSFADAVVAASAERHGGRILTLDRGSFDAVARGEGSITLVP